MLDHNGIFGCTGRMCRTPPPASPTMPRWLSGRCPLGSGRRSAIVRGGLVARRAAFIWTGGGLRRGWSGGILFGQDRDPQIIRRF